MWRSAGQTYVEASYVEASWADLCGGQLDRPMWRPAGQTYVEASWADLCYVGLSQIHYRILYL